MKYKVYYRTVERDGFLEFHVSRIRSELDGPDSLCCKIPLDSAKLKDFKKAVDLDIRQFNLIEWTPEKGTPNS